MRVLVTGAAGFLGEAVVHRLAASGRCEEIRCLVRPSSDTRRLPAGGGATSIAVVRRSLTRREGLDSVARGMDIVLHLAAGVRGNITEMFLNTVVGTRNMLDALPREKPPRFVLISSFSVYGTPALPRNTVLNEDTPLETEPVQRDPYAYVKWRQEKLVREYRHRLPLDLVTVRPGMIYGPRGGGLPTRVGISIGGVFVHLGGNNLLPMTYVDNCADAIVAAAFTSSGGDETYNVVDDDLLTAKDYLASYRREVRNIRTVRIPYVATILLSRMVHWYHRYSRGQLPDILTPYKSRALWKGLRFDNSKLHQIGWRQAVSTEEGLRRTFESLAAQT